MSLRNTFNRQVSFRFFPFPARSNLVFGLLCTASLNVIVGYQLPSKWIRLTENITRVYKINCVWHSGDKFQPLWCFDGNTSNGAFLFLLINYNKGKGSRNGLRSNHVISDVHRISELAIHSLSRG